MTDQGDGAWFRVRPRRLGWGYNYVPITWQGWAIAIGLAPVILATVFAGDPSMAKPSSVAFFIRMKALLGLNGVHLPPVTVAALIVTEVATFVGLLIWKSRSLRPLD